MRAELRPSHEVDIIRAPERYRRGRMALFKDIAAVAAECVRTPGHVSIWDKDLGRYVCAKDPRFQGALQKQSRSSPAPIDPTFKLVFITATAGTLLFVVICVATTIAAGRDMPPAWEKL